MQKTKLTIDGSKFLINDSLTYSEIKGCKYQGLLMNARFIQGIFDEQENVEQFNRFGKTFNPEQNTDELIEALPAWYDKGLRAFTVGLQGGGPCFTVVNSTMTNHPYKMVDGKVIIEPAYKARLVKLLKAADAIGMVVIVSCFYPGQMKNVQSPAEIIGAVEAVCDVLLENDLDNAIIEICNEYDLNRKNPLIGTDEGVAGLIVMAQKYMNGRYPVGCSLMGGNITKLVTEASDVVIIHGNGCSRQSYMRMVERVRAISPDKPILCNEDSQALGNMVVSMDDGVSWGYYNNMTKQEPPTDWTITEGEDQFFAERMAIMLGLSKDQATYKEQTAEANFFLQGVDNEQKVGDKRWVRVASLYPETINYVDFYHNDKKVYRCYDESFTLGFVNNWRQSETITKKGDVFTAKITLADGTVITKKATDNL